jgi:hypothetical protein
LNPNFSMRAPFGVDCRVLTSAMPSRNIKGQWPVRKTARVISRCSGVLMRQRASGVRHYRY